MVWAVDSKINWKIRLKLAVYEDVYGSEEGAPRVHNFSTKCVEWSALRPDRFTPIQYWVGDWMERRFGLDAADKVRFCDAARLLPGHCTNWATTVSGRRMKLIRRHIYAHGDTYWMLLVFYVPVQRGVFWTGWWTIERRMFLTVEVWMKTSTTIGITNIGTLLSVRHLSESERLRNTGNKCAK